MSAPTPTDDGGNAGNVVTRTVARGTQLVRGQRARRPWFDHLVHAGGHYNRAQGDLLASGVTYYVFLALFPVLLLLTSVAGFVLAGNPLLARELVDAVREAVPGSTGEQLAGTVSGAIEQRGTTGAIGLAGFLFVGLGAMDKLRVGMDLVWRGVPDPPDFLADRVKDLLALLGFALATVLSIGLTTGTTAASEALLDLLGLDRAPGLFLLTAALGTALAIGGDTLVFLWLLTGVPNTPFRFRQVLPGALFGAIGFEVLKAVGGYYLSLQSANVTVSALGSVVGLVVWINVVARFAFFTASWTATIPAVERVRLGLADGPAPPAPGGCDEGAPGRPPAVSPVRLAAGLIGAGAVAGSVAGALGSRAVSARRGRRRADEPVDV